MDHAELYSKAILDVLCSTDLGSRVPILAREDTKSEGW